MTSYYENEKVKWQSAEVAKNILLLVIQFEEKYR
jgi:hypothetical protein